jgi:hypothetical protein
MARTDSPAPAKDRQTSSSFLSITSWYLLPQLSAVSGQFYRSSQKGRRSLTGGQTRTRSRRQLTLRLGRPGTLGLSSLSRALHQLLTSGYASCSAARSRFKWAETAKTDINN